MSDKLPNKQQGEGMDASGTDAVDELLAACLRHSNSTDQLKALETACADNPSWSQDLRDRYQTLVSLGLDGIAAGPGQGAVVGRQANSVPGVDSFGDFELLEVIGSGGMGIVHRARQLSLNREVVVKLVRPELLYFDGSRKRFKREAEAISRLKHPGIVPVLAAGEHEGIPYFAMEFVAGRSLEKVIQELQNVAGGDLGGGHLAAGLSDLTYVDAVLQIGRQLAAALLHAHQRGILHRDVKPSNVLLSDEGETCLIDFGLHALHDPESQESDAEHESTRLTREGSALGTLLYMAPEQLEEGIYDVRGEVYALGATLFELLALEPPFRGENRSSTERLIRQGKLEPLRNHNRSVPPDVDAVLQSALAVDPVRRYVDMRAFGDDLQRLIERRPVAARPAGMLYHLRRWTARQPALATALGVLALLAIVVPGAWIRSQAQHNRDLEAALAKEQDARQSAEDLSAYVIEVLESADPNLNEPNVAVQGILRKGVERLNTRLANQPLRLAEMRRVLARIHHNLGLWDVGRELASQSLATWVSEHEKRVQTGASSERVDLALDQVIESRTVLAWQLEHRQQIAAALRHRILLEKEIGQLAKQDSWNVLHARANWMRLAQKAPKALPDGRPTPSHGEYMSALRELINALDRSRGAPKEWKHQAAALGWLGTALAEEAQRPQFPDAKSTFQESQGFLERSIEEHQRVNLGDSVDCATAWMTLGLVKKKLGDLEGGEQAYLRAIDTFQKRLPPNHYLLGGALVNLAGVLEARGSGKEAVTYLEEADQIFKVSLGPDDPNSVVTFGNLVGTRYRAGLTEGLLPLLDELIPRQIAVFREMHPFVASSLEYRAILRRKAGDATGAMSDGQRSNSIFEKCFGSEHPRSQATAKMLEEWAGE